MGGPAKQGINVVENEETEENTQSEDKTDTNQGVVKGNVDDTDLGRTDDPVRMYLREMGSVELLSREGEISIAKRIEAGRDMMISSIFENPLTMRSIAEWYDDLKIGDKLLREIIDLDVTNTGGPASQQDTAHLQGIKA